MNPPPRPTPPTILRVCDWCHKPWHTCYCRAFCAAVLTYAIVGAIVAFVALSCSAREYDAETDIGLVANSEAIP